MVMRKVGCKIGVNAEGNKVNDATRKRKGRKRARERNKQTEWG